MGVSWLEVIGIAVGLSMDAFAVSVCKGLAAGRATPRHMAAVGLWFGAFQALMPLIGYFLGSTLAGLMTSAAPWIACILLAIIGGNMALEGIRGEENSQNADFSPRAMLPLAVATAIDALATGVAFAAMDTASAAVAGPSGICAAVAVIGLITCALSAVGVKLGSVFGAKYRSGAQIFGGIVLIGIGVKILVEHLAG